MKPLIFPKKTSDHLKNNPDGYMVLKMSGPLDPHPNQKRLPVENHTVGPLYSGHHAGGPLMRDFTI